MPEEPNPDLRSVAPDRYSEFELVGKGGMGVVYLALDSELNRRVAFKMVLPGSESGSGATAPQTPLQATPPQDTESGSGRSFGELKARFMQEAWITSGMEHPGIVPVYELGETEEGVPYYTMRYVRGERTMKEAIKAAHDLEERLFLLEPFLKVCDTIRYAHARGIVHRDIKPENIAIGEFGEVIVLDWGLSKVEGKPDITSQRWQERIELYRDATDLKTVAGALGTPGFMAPEATLGRTEEVDARSDIYSLGAMLFCILTGRLPYQFENFLEFANKALREDPPRVDEIDPMLPRELADACARALARERDDRFQDVDDLAHAVRVWQTEGPIEREIRGLLDQTRDEVEASQGLEGNLQLLHLDRATAALNRILHLQADHEDALLLQTRVKRMRERGIRARVRTDRLVVLQRVAAGLLSVGAIVALVVFGMLNKERERAEEMRREAGEETAAARTRRDMAEADADRKSAQLAKAYAAIANSLLDERRNAAARIIAARAIEKNPNATAWTTFAQAEASWSPTLRASAYGVRARSLAVSGGSDLTLLIGDDEGRVHRISVVADQKSRESWDALNAAITAVLSFAGPDGPLIAAGGADGHIAILQADTPKRVFPGELKPAPKVVPFEDETLYRGTAVTALAPGPSPGSLLAGYADGRLRLFDQQGKLIHVARHHAGAVTSIASRGQLAYSGSADGSINLWLPAGLILQDTWTSERNRPVAGFRIGEDANLDAWSTDCSVWTHTRRKPGVVVRMAGLPHEAAGAVLLDHARVLAFATKPQGVLRFLDLANGRVLAQGVRSNEEVVAVAGTEAGKLFAVARADNSIRVWDLEMRRDETLVGVAHRATGRAAVARADGSIAVHEIGEPIVLPAQEPVRISALALGPDAERLLAVTLSGTIEIWDILKEERIRKLRDPDGTPITAVAWAQGDRRLFTGDLNGTVRLWPWATGRRLSLPDATTAPITVLTRESPSFRVAAADASGAVHLWDSGDTKAKLKTWDYVGAVVALALADAGEEMVAALEDGTLLRCDGETWDVIGALPIGARPVEFRVLPSEQIVWVDQHGLTGTFDHYDSAGQLPVDKFGAPWVRIPHEERFRLLGETFGLKIDDYRVVAVPAAKLAGAINLAR